MNRIDSILEAAMYIPPRKYNEIVDVKKSIIGSNVWLISRCPECDEKNTIFDIRSKPTNIKYECDWCGLKYKGAIKLIKVVVPMNEKHRKHLTKKQKEGLCEKQHQRCYWCHRKFTTYLYDRKSNRIKPLNPVYDHYKAFSFTFDNRIENFVASCQPCNSFKHNMYFETENDCREILESKWNKALNSGRFELHYLKG
jgi:predicted RNA-binding Zn-ribbon protein involved in translation (DUF1610 family)